MDPDWVMNETSDMGRRLLFAFSQREIEEVNEKIKKQNTPGKGGK